MTASPTTKASFSIVNFLAKLLSVLVHPLFIPMYFFAWVCVAFPTEFTSVLENAFIRKGMVLFANVCFFPGIAIFLLWRLQFIGSLQMHTQKERIVPYIIVMFFYWWMYYLSRSFTDEPLVFRMFYFGNFVCISIALVCNSFFKISMHTMGVGGLVAAMVFTCIHYNTLMGGYLLLAVLAAGLLGTVRLWLHAHTAKEIYIGYIVSIVSQCAAAWYIL
ncbi:MAG: hypothetical protein EAZ47_05695 [Bacteroidetes bacterium]|nr:MAG: hypothetical protein EAY72_04850 [Bacteroidota bacterium]TAF93741.1 MAG: hypothetical protein EAZ47_05695 [Bacteroidota bacterium]